MSDQTPRRKLAAILAADVVGFSLKMGVNEDRTLKNLKACRAITDESIKIHHGRIFTTAGDSVIAEFASPVDAIIAAVEFQKSIMARNAACAQEDQMQFRVGLNLGDVIVEGDNLYGDGVNVAARIESSAQPGGVHVSAKFYEEVRRKLDLSFESLGEHYLKNIADPVATFRVNLELEGTKAAYFQASKNTHNSIKPQGFIGTSRLLDFKKAVFALTLLVILGLAGYWGFQKSNQPLVNPLSIAVIPFVNLTGDSAQGYVADGLTARVTTDLFRIRDAVVIDASKTLKFKDVSIGAEQVAKELGVRYLLQGDVQKNADTILINAKLIDSSYNKLLWSESFSGEMSNLFALQDQVTNRISGSLGPRMLIVAASESEKRQSNPHASDLILQARGLLEKGFDVETLNRRVSFYRKALLIEPDNIEAMSGLAQALGQLAPRSPEQGLRGKRFEESYSLAVKVKDIDPSNRDIYSALIFYYREKGDLISAKQNAEKNLSLNSKSKSPYITLGNILNQSGEPDKAIIVLTQGLNLDPMNPTDNNLSSLGRAHMILGNINTSIEWLLKANQINSKVSQIWAYLAVAYAMKGESEKSALAVIEVKKLNPNSNLNTLTFFIKPLPASLPSYKEWYQKTYLPAYRKAGLPE
jgi:TolB-like protein/class 3 adenylate cyclase/Flp pilus assembly protein TadD